MQSNQKLINSDKKPIELFQEWFEEAKKSEINDPNAMNLLLYLLMANPARELFYLNHMMIKGLCFTQIQIAKKVEQLKTTIV